ncbi:MAG: type II secretion system secretin GspD [Bdellovibrionaceae bacterium]|nr:type II secretion system secretin GspD [Pseudobdellovibrionaceae bacterium]
MKRWLSLLLAASLVADQTLTPQRAWAQEEDLDKLFEEDASMDDPTPPFGEPPPLGGPQDFDNPPPGAGFPPSDIAPPAQPPSASAPSGGGGFSGGRAGTAKVSAPKGDVKERFSKAEIEDITNANFPETIESFDFPNADIKDVIKAISELTGKNFIIDNTISGRVTIMAPSKITVAEAYKAFLSALAGLGFTIVPSGKFLKIKNARAAQRDSIETYSGNYFPNADVLITRIVQLKNTSAEEVNKRLRILPSKDGEMTPYEPTNSLIITDYGSNVDRMMKIIHEIDKPGFEETLEVIPIRYAKARDLADMLNQIINKEPGGASAGGFRAGVPRFRSRGSSTSGAPEELSLVAPDERTNAIIVLGTKAGIDKVKSVVKKLDYRLDPSEAGGVFVYYVKHGEAEKIASVLQGVSQGSGATSTGGATGGASPAGVASATRPFTPPGEKHAIFGGDVKITADKVTNSLVILASKQDYDTVRTLLNKIDIPRDQVYVEAIIMEMSTQKLRDWNPAVYKFEKGTDGYASGRAGYSRAGTLEKIFNPATDAGAILSFGSSDTMKIKLGTSEFTVPGLAGFLNFLQTNTETNILSTPQILALDNEEASIEAGDSIPIAEATTTQTGGTTAGTRFEKAPIKLELTPFISPDSEAVRMKIVQTVKQQNGVVTSGGQSLPQFVERGLKSNIVVNSGDTAVLGGLVRDSEVISESKVPILGDIPVLGWLFKSSQKRREKANLLIFLTPKIIRNQEQSQEQLTKKANDRIEWLKENFDGRDPYGGKIEKLPRAAAPDAESGTSKRRRN